MDSPSQVKLMQNLLEREGYAPVGINDPRRVEESHCAGTPQPSFCRRRNARAQRLSGFAAI